MSTTSRLIDLPEPITATLPRRFPRVDSTGAATNGVDPTTGALIAPTTIYLVSSYVLYSILPPPTPPTEVKVPPTAVLAASRSAFKSAVFSALISDTSK